MLRAVIAILVLALAVPAAQAQGRAAPRFDPGACEPGFCAESDWIFDDNRTSHTTRWRHGLRSTPRFVMVMFSPDPDNGPVYPVMWSLGSQSTGNPGGIELTNRMVLLQISHTIPLHGIWKPETGWKRYTEGYWKIIVYR